MRVTSPPLALCGLAIAILTFGFAKSALPAESSRVPYTLTVVDRTIAQDRVPQEKGGQDQKWFWQTWQIDYQLRLEGPTALVVTPTDIRATVEGWVSNSRVPSHAVPQWSSLVISGGSGLTSVVDLIETADEAQRCRERASVRVWPGNETAEPTPSGSSEEQRSLLNVAPGSMVRVRLRLVHQHFLYGMYDPLLGRRSFEIHLGAATLRDTLPLDREHHVAQALAIWTSFPDDRRDTRQFVSPPDSLHLEAHVPGNQYFRLPEHPVRYATKMRLRFWYLVAPGTEGECKARVQQYKDTPTAWKVLSEGSFEECLKVAGRWVHVERVFCTQSEATTLALDFRIAGADIGELWIDDITLEPVGAGPEGP
jgi:hypothetical protein